MLFCSIERQAIFKRLWIFVFCWKYGKNIGKNITIKNLSNKYSQKLLEHVQQSVTDALKTASKRAIQKTAEATGDLAGNKIDDVTTKISRSSPKNSSETFESETKNARFDREMPNERCISPKKAANYSSFKINVIT